MQNVDGVEGSESLKDVKTVEVGQAILTPPSSGSPVMEKNRVLTALHQQNFMDLSGSDEGEASEVCRQFLSDISRRNRHMSHCFVRPRKLNSPVLILNAWSFTDHDV